MWEGFCKPRAKGVPRSHLNTLIVQKRINTREMRHLFDKPRLNFCHCYDQLHGNVTVRNPRLHSGFQSGQFLMG